MKVKDEGRYMGTGKILNKLKASPQMLYPTETIAGINDKLTKQCYEAYLSGKGQSEEVLAVRYHDCLYIYEGHEQVLAAAQFNLIEIDVTEVDRNSIGFWADDEAFTGTLRDIGITAVYDFEASGGFRYESYPSFYAG